MSGECKSYRLNEPMKWHEFLAMPEDIQVTYIRLIREKWNPPIVVLANMMGCDRANLSKYLKSLGFDKAKRGTHPWDKTGFAEWAYGIPAENKEEPDEEVKDEVPVEACEIPVEEYDPVEEEIPATNEENISFVEVPNPRIKVNLIKEDEAPAFAYPISGSMNFEGKTKDIINTLSALLLGKKVKLSVSWEVIND